MPEWLSGLMQTERLLTVAFVLFLLWMMGKAIFKSWPLLSKTVTLMNALVGNGEHNSGLVAQMESMAGALEELKTQVRTIHHETTPNHGGSMNDALKRVEKKLTDHIVIAVKSDERQEETAKIVADYLPKVKRLLGEE